MASEDCGSYDSKEYAAYLEQNLSTESNTSEAQDEVNGVPLSPNRNKTKMSPRRSRRSGGANRERKRQSDSCKTTSHNNDPDVQGSLSDSVDDLNAMITVDLDADDEVDKQFSSFFRSQSSGANREGKRPSDSRNLQKAEGKSGKKARCCSGEPSASQRAEPEGKKENPEGRIEKIIEDYIKEKPIPNVIRILQNMVYRGINNMPHMKSLMLLSSVAHVDLDQILSQCPVLSALKNIDKEIKAIEASGMVVTEELKGRLVKIGGKIEKQKRKQREDKRKVENLQRLFINERVSVKTLRDKLSSEFPWLPWEETATNMPTANQDHGSLQTCVQWQFLVKDFKDFESRLFVNDRIVKVSDFQGLQEEIEKTTDSGSNVPDCLKPIAMRIEKARGKTTGFIHGNITLLVCAAIQEMERTQLKDLDKHMLSTWGATLKQAREIGFQVDFAESLFGKNLYAYYLRSKVG